MAIPKLEIPKVDFENKKRFPNLLPKGTRGRELQEKAVIDEETRRAQQLQRENMLGEGNVNRFSNQTTDSIQTGLQTTSNNNKLNAMKDMFNKAFESQKSQIEGQRETLKPRFRTERSRIGVEDTMARTGTEKIQATQGLSGAGARSQSDIAQNVLTQGALGQSRATEAEQNRLLDQAILQAAQQRDLGIAQGELQEAQLQDERAYQQQLLNQQIARENQLLQEEINRADALRTEQQAETASQLERDQFIQTIGRFAQDYTAEINRVQNDGEPRNDWQIPLLEQARQEKIVSQNLDPATGLPLPVDTTPNITSSSAAIDLWRQLGTANEAISRALGIPVGTRYTERAIGGTSGPTYAQQVSLAKWKAENGYTLTPQEAQILGEPITGTGTNFLETAQSVLNPVSIDTISDNKKAVLERLINNPSLHGNDPARLQSILDQQKITIDELEVYEEWRDRALADRAFQ